MRAMPLAITPLTDLSDWARRSGLEIVLIVLGAVLVARFIGWAGGRIAARIDANSVDTDALVRSESSKHRYAVSQVVTWVAVVATYSIATVLVLQRIGVPLTGLVAPATVAGVALGFGAQRVVQDLLAGFFLITEKQYGFGDTVRLAVTGVGTPVTGTVEDLTLRVTRMRSVNGEVIMTPNGQIVQVTNLSRDWARAVVDVPAPATADVNLVTDVLHRVGDELFADADLRPLLLDPPTVMGVESFEVDQFNIRMVARTLPGKQFEVGRAMRARIAVALRECGLYLPAELEATDPTALQ